MGNWNFNFNGGLWDFGDAEEFVEVANYAALPATGETDVIYVTIDDNKLYRWSGSIYIPLSAPSWNKTGNSGTNPSADFIGTTDNVDLVFKRNNVEIARALSGNIFNIGSDPYVLSIGGASTTGAFLGGYAAAGGGAPNVYVGSNCYFNGGWVKPVAGRAGSMYSQTGGIHSWWTASTGDVIGSAKMTILNNGNVSIGTGTDGGRLYIQAQGALSTDNVFRIRNSGDNADILNITGDSKFVFNGAGHIGDKTQTSDNVFSLSIGGINDATNGTGKVVIGGSNSRLELTSGQGSNGIVRFMSPGGNFAFSSYDMGYMPYEHFGIQLSKASTNYYTILSSNSNQSSGFSIQAGGRTVDLGNQASPKQFSLFTNTGNIVIGQITPVDAGYKLDVNGTSRVQKINISAIPTSSAGLVAGDVWNDAGTLKIV